MGWYVLRTIPGRETQAAELLKNKVDRRLWKNCRILKKQQLFRIHGKYEMGRKEMFPGYLFVFSEQPEKLAEALERSREFPQILGNQKIAVTPLEEKDLEFLQTVCGRELEHDMRLSTVTIDKQNKITEASGALKAYLGNITKQRLNKRFVIAKVPLFNREEEILFGIRVENDYW